MILTDYFTATPSNQWRWAKQTGVNHAVIRLPEEEDFHLTSAVHWRALCDRFYQYGLTPLVIEPLPNCLHDHIKVGDEKRDAAIETLLHMFPIMQRLGITTICVNFMAHVGWYRTNSTIPTRGGALVTGFRQEECGSFGDATITEEELWDNLTYFLTAVVPAAEKYGIRLALHPDDPPVARLGKVSRILTSVQNMQRAVDLVPSDNVGITFCQGTFATMGEDVCAAIAQFAGQNKLFLVHFRDICGDKTAFHETFHDDGKTDMAQAIRMYQQVQYHGPVRVDHVPTMAGEDNQNAGYAGVGRVFAMGYLKGLLDGCGYAYQ